MVRFIVLAVALAGANAALLADPEWPSSTQINHPDVINALNADTTATWKAGHNARFEGMTFADAKVLLGTTGTPLLEADLLEQAVYDAVEDVPTEFDARTKWGSLIHPIRDQAHCGSCWAFSAAEVLSDRFAIATNKTTPSLSPEDLVSCDKGDMGCSGGQLPHAWAYLSSTGIVTDKCFPYGAASGNAPKCATKCADSETWTKYKAKSGYAVKGVANMQKEIMTNGPIQVAFKVYGSFMSYKSGVYSKKWYEFIPKGGHAVKIVGWGTESGTDYWLVANSWNTSWGDKGFFKIKRGVNECGMESMGPPYAGMPAL